MKFTILKYIASFCEVSPCELFGALSQVQGSQSIHMVADGFKSKNSNRHGRHSVIFPETASRLYTVTLPQNFAWISGEAHRPYLLMGRVKAMLKLSQGMGDSVLATIKKKKIFPMLQKVCINVYFY